MLKLSHILDGVSVVEIASYIPGPLCGALLASLGATVVKIERPGGDPMRAFPPSDHSGEHPLFAILNRSKQCYTLNLRQPADQAKLYDLIRSADVLIDGLRPGALGQLGLTDETLLETNPRLLIVAISGLPPEHPHRHMALHDLNAQALGGVLAASADDPRTPGVHAADMVSGLAAAAGVLAGLLARHTSNRGGRIETSLLSAAQWLNMPALALALAGLLTDDTLNGQFACYRLYQTADHRYLAVAALEAHFWQRVCTVIERPDLIPLQYERSAQPMVISALSDIFRQRPLPEWQAIFDSLDTCVSPVLTPLDATRERSIRPDVGFGSLFTVQD